LAIAADVAAVAGVAVVAVAVAVAAVVRFVVVVGFINELTPQSSAAWVLPLHRYPSAFVVGHFSFDNTTIHFLEKCL